MIHARRFAIVVLLMSTAASAQEPPAKPAQEGTLGGRIGGLVVAADTGLPLAGASILIHSTAPASTALPSGGQQVTSGLDGSFEFAGVPAGSFALRVTRAGYFLNGATTVLVRDRQRTAVTLAMNRGGAITGRIVGEFGEPVAGVQVQGYRHEYVEDGSRSSVPAGVSDLTDDLGEFRLYGLLPGDFTISAGGRNAALGTFSLLGEAGSAPTYYPGTLHAAEARMVSLGPGQETSVQFTLLDGRVATVSGRVVSTQGTVAPGLIMVTLASATGSSTVRMPSNASREGTFAFPGVLPGDYWIVAEGVFQTPGERETGALAVRVGADDITDLSLSMRRGATLRGTVVFDGPRPASVRVVEGFVDPSTAQTFPLRLEFVGGPRVPYAAVADSGGLPIIVQEDGRFEVGGAVGRVIIVPVRADWMITSVSGAGPNALEAGIDTEGRNEINGIRITVSNKLTEVSGRVTGGKGEALAGQLVLLQRLDGPLQRDRAARALRTDEAGRFETKGLLPGSYVAAALDDLEPGAQFAPEFRERLRERGHRFSLRDGEAVTLELTPTRELK
jgi:hypothetical protein